MRKGETNKQPTGFSSSDAKMARTKDDDEDEEDWDMKLNSTLSGLVVGSSPTQPTVSIPLRKPAEPLWKPFGRRWSTIRSAISYRWLLLFVAFFRVTLADLTFLTPDLDTFKCF